MYNIYLINEQSMIQVNVIFILIFTDLKHVNGIDVIFLLFNPEYTLPIYFIFLKYITSLIQQDLGEGVEGVEQLIRNHTDKINIFCDYDQEYNLVENWY